MSSVISHSKSPIFKHTLFVTTALVTSLVSVPVLAQEIINDTDETVIGSGDGTSGTQDSPWVIEDDLTIGTTGTGTLTISEGGTVSNAGGTIGALRGAVGRVEVTGAGSTWTNSGSLHVGDEGTGILSISDAGTVESRSGRIGGFFLGGSAVGSGSVTVDGIGSGWFMNNSLRVGDVGGSTGFMTISGGATVINDEGVIGGFPDADGEVVVTGAGSDWTNLGDLLVGDFGTGYLEISDGGNVSSSSGYIGNYEDSGADGTVIVTGENSQWTNTENLYVGNYRPGRLTISDGGTVINDIGYIGYDKDGTGSVLVTGENANWTNNQFLYVGAEGRGSLTISDGGRVSNAAGVIGLDEDSRGAVAVSGENANWINDTFLFVGESGTGLLRILEGGTVTSSIGNIGYNAEAEGTVLVEGDGANWTNSDELFVGFEGAGSLTIAEGGTVNIGSGIGVATLAWDADSTGTLNIGAARGDEAVGAGVLEAAAIEFGEGDAELVFNHSDTDYIFDLDVNGTGDLSHLAGTTTLTGAIDITGNTIVDGGRMVVAGTLNNSRGDIGSDASADGTVVVTGEGSNWSNSGFLDIGATGTGRLTISEGGMVSNTHGSIGDDAGADGTVLVTGTGSNWTNSDFLDIGAAGTGSLSIADGGMVSNTNGYIGFREEAVGTVLVTGAGSRWTNDGALRVGDLGTGNLIISDGSMVSNTNGTLGEEAGSDGTVLVTGANALWANDSNLIVGGEGTGNLTISDGGTVDIANGAGTMTLAEDLSGVGILNIGAASGEDAVGAGTLQAALLNFGDGDEVLQFNHTDTDYTFDVDIRGSGDISHRAGITTLTGTSDFIGSTSVNGGTLVIDDAASYRSSSLRIAGGEFINAGTLEATSSITVASTGLFTNTGIVNGNINNAGTINGAGSFNGAVTNAGSFQAGGTDSIGTAMIIGGFVQTEAGSFTVDVDGSAETADLISINGTADLAGTVDVNVLAGSPVGTFTILTATEGVINNGVELGEITSVFDNPLAELALVFPDATEVALGFALNAESDGLNANQRSILANINEVNSFGGGDLSDTIAALFDLGTEAETADALDHLSPEIYLNTTAATVQAVEAFADQLFSCQLEDESYSVGSTDMCFWARPQGRFIERDQTAENIGYQEHSDALSFGGEQEVRPGLAAGFAFGYETSNLKNDSTDAFSESERFHAGVSVKHTKDDFELSGAAVGGISHVATTRGIGFGDFAASSTSDHDITYVGVQVRASYLLAQGDYYLKPLVALNATSLTSGGFDESGNPATDLVVQDSNDVFFSVSPAVELGFERGLAARGQVIRGYARGGVSIYAADAYALDTSFAGAPSGTSHFEIMSQFDDVVADMEAGISFTDNKNATLEVGYRGRISDNTEQHGGFLKVSMNF